MNWTWSQTKADVNFKKHGVSFELASRVFGDPMAVTVPDPYAGEERWRTIGQPSSASPIILLVVHTWPVDDKDEGRIISARRAEPNERRAYEEGQF